jgi:hypothetical protein
MAEKDKLFSSKVKYNGIVNFADFYKFCYEWLRDETGLLLSENKYSEKITGEEKNIEIEWNGYRDVTDYFRFEVKVFFRILSLTNVELTQGNRKIKTNKGSVEVGITGNLVRDYEGKFEKSAFQKFLRGIYEKSVIHARIEQFQEKIISDCDEFLSQAKAYLDLIGKR